MTKEIEEIQGLAQELTRKLKVMLERKSLTAEQDETTSDAYHGLLFWRRAQLALMIKAFGINEKEK